MLRGFVGEPVITQCIITKDFLKYLRPFYEEINIEQKELEIVFVAM